jgi:hypothetical protein
MSPMERTLAYFKGLGAVVGRAEHWNPFCKRRVDLLNFIDLIAILGPNLIAVQVTSGTHHADHKAKILAEPKALAWLKTGALIELHSWSKTGPRGKRKTWAVRKEEIIIEDFK